MIEEKLKTQLLAMDGAMGTLVSQLTQSKDICDFLNLTNPDLIQKIHGLYLKAGADILKTNTFNSNRLSLKKSEYAAQVEDLNEAAVEIAQLAIKHCSLNKEIILAGVLGPTQYSLSGIQRFPIISQSEFTESFNEQGRILTKSGVDVLLIETCFDLKNALVVLEAIQEFDLPIMLSFTINEEGKLLSGESIEEIHERTCHYKIMSIGLNCSFGIAKMMGPIKKLASLSSTYISFHPNAGLPDKFGNYPNEMDSFKVNLKNIIDSKAANIIGGCCGTTDEHIKIISDIIKQTSEIRHL